MYPTRGRIISLSPLLLRNTKGVTQLSSQISIKTLNLGDWVEITEPNQIKVLTPNKHGTFKWMDHVLDPKRVHALKMRDQVEFQIHHFFKKRDFLHTRTPLLVPCPGMEPHIRPFQTVQGPYLPTSPEFAMKRLLAGGLNRIYQISPVFRQEIPSHTHLPEFTMLEWYRAYAGYEQIMVDTEELFEELAFQIFGKPKIMYQGQMISLKKPWPRLRVRDLFETYTQINLVETNTIEKLRVHCTRLGLNYQSTDTWDDLYFRVWLNKIEPHLPKNQAVFVIRYPKTQAALSVIDQDLDGSFWAKRFEVYAGGLELANAFEELTDPVEQKNRFIKDMELRNTLYGDSFPKTPIDQDFIHALEEGIPPSGGIALGVDRMVMLFADEPNIEKTFWLTPQGVYNQ